jgi:hypothetical protein
LNEEELKLSSHFAANYSNDCRKRQRIISGLKSFALAHGLSRRLKRVYGAGLLEMSKKMKLKPNKKFSLAFENLLL